MFGVKTGLRLGGRNPSASRRCAICAMVHPLLASSRARAASWGVVAELGQAGDRAGDLPAGVVPARPGDLHVYLLAGAEHGDADLLDQVPDQLLAVSVSGGGGIPHRGQVGGQGAGLLAFGGGQRPGAGGAEAVVLLA